MKINGYTLRTAIRNREMERDAAIANLPRLAAMGESARLGEMMTKIELLEKKIAKLQALQTSYNLQVMVQAGTEKISMAEAVKRIGGIERVSKQWRSLIDTMNAPSSAALASDPSVATELAVKEARQAANEASLLRGAINASNSVEIDIPEITEDMVS